MIPQERNERVLRGAKAKILVFCYLPKYLTLSYEKGISTLGSVPRGKCGLP
jgi:hypothetical protein